MKHIARLLGLFFVDAVWNRLRSELRGLAVRVGKRVLTSAEILNGSVDCAGRVRSRLQLQLSVISKDLICTLHPVKAIACSESFHNQGLRLDTQRLGVEDLAACPNCGH